ncbi:hypothetical protein TEA_022721 [Camellia sinensis var. sinensis]|uniref:C2 domain-containing protein n=1 Tax=Camellia sinensis var. sinensis TaxID=542762 RepID=A0A4S4F1K3_CAMSN|nr:hypothetical protein TEA_022721 [Camellia sinensis var. sinensis]
MTVEKEDLGLSLSLSFPENRSSLQLNLMPPSSPFPSAPFNPQKMTSWNDNFPSFDRNSETCRVETRSLLKGIDVNRVPSTIDCEEEAGVSSPNSTISSISGKRSEREEPNGEDLDLYLERASSRGISDKEDGDTSRKKLRLSKDLKWDYRGQRKILPLGQWLPKIAVDAYVAPNVVLAGQVTICDGASVWNGSVLRGDLNKITVGFCSNVQERCVVHAAWSSPTGLPAEILIERFVTIGAYSLLRSCTIEPECIIGQHSIPHGLITMEKNQRTLKISFISAKDLQRVQLLNKMEVCAYVFISGGGKPKTTVDRDGDTNPTWNGQITFNLGKESAETQIVVFELNCCDQNDGDKVIGEVFVKVKDLMGSIEGSLTYHV